ncbi:hypothetical protein [Clostridium sp. BJN0013]|uniref:hypothetical protein n=1 Tax=Clostridium sp. BJN0013 TaxID=3236840 RepID=UPI0034C69CCC
MNFCPSPVKLYYNFKILFSCLWLSDHELHVEHKLKPKKFVSKPKKKLKAGQKQPPKHSGTVKKLVDKAMEGKLRNFCPETILQKFIACCVVDTSSAMGILGDINNLSIAFDGSPFYSGASHYGVKVCDCKSKGIYNCQCPRRFSDPDAHWGWDSYRQQWFFGNTLFNVTASDGPYDLPIYIKMVQASRHDSITTVFALQDIHNLYPHFRFGNFIADGAMDNYPTYELLNHYDILPFIFLNSKTKAKFDYPHPDILCSDDKGNPICMGGIPFVNWGYYKPKGIKYRCYFGVKENSNRHHLSIHWSITISLNQSPKEIFTESAMFPMTVSIKTSFWWLFAVFRMCFSSCSCLFHCRIIIMQY